MTLEIEAPATIEMEWNGNRCPDKDDRSSRKPIRQTKLKVRPQTRVRHNRRRQENGLNKTCLKKAGQYGSRNPVSDCVRLILVMKSPLELMPDMNMSMMIVMTVYPEPALMM